MDTQATRLNIPDSGTCASAQTCVCVCVCVSTSVSKSSWSHVIVMQNAGGSEHSIIHCPTKTVIEVP